MRAGAAPQWSERLVWMGLAACASALLLAVTNHLTQNVAAIPFLWVLPLSLYLLSFILCFDSDRWYNRWLFTRLAAVACRLPSPTRFPERKATSIEPQASRWRSSASRHCLCCSWCAMGNWRAGGPRPRYLTSFYLMVSVGGAIGGLLVGFAAPYFLNGLYDLPIIVSLTAFLLVYLLWHERGKNG